jgi:hypothetical protein
MTRIELIKKIGKEFPKGKGAEIGTFQGEFSKEILNVWNGTLFMIDVWDNIAEGYNDSSNQLYFDYNIYSEAIKNIKGLEDRGLMIRATSEKASTIFNKSSLDFAYIDANHAYDYVKQDIELWWPKIKKGGYLCGHDYIAMDWYNDPNFAPNGKDKYIWNGNFYHGVFGVNPAVDEFCEKLGYEKVLTSEWFGTWLIKKL